MTATDEMDKATALLQAASRVVVFSGAGMSADAGISTFRKDPNSLWSGILGGMTLAYFGTPWGWKITPGLAWRKYCEVFLSPILEAHPHPGHHALVRLEQERFSPLPVITMNVDGLHQRAGHLAENVAELHGSVTTNRCREHGMLPASSPVPAPADGGSGTDVAASVVEEMKKLKCSICGRSPRPNVVLFGESLPATEWNKAMRALDSLQPDRYDVLLIVGTTGAVYPAAGLPEQALRRGIRIIEVNLHPSPISTAVDVFLQGQAKDLLPALVEKVLGEKKGS